LTDRIWGAVLKDGRDKLERVGGPQRRSGGSFGEDKYLLNLPGSKPRFLDCRNCSAIILPAYVHSAVTENEWMDSKGKRIGKRFHDKAVGVERKSTLELKRKTQICKQKRNQNRTK
jgi:hypothetical protein